MTGVRGRETGVRKPVTGVAPRSWVFAIVAMLLTLPILGHGCHRGDHDDEPLFAPLDHHATQSELPR
jgi:hypothetical protein